MITGPVVSIQPYVSRLEIFVRRVELKQAFYFSFNMKNLFIDILAFGTLFSSVLVITSKNPVIAVIFLISVFVNAAGYLILLGIGFIGISYLIIYVRSHCSIVLICAYDARY